MKTIKPEYKMFHGKGDIDYIIDGLRLFIVNMESTLGRKMTRKEYERFAHIFHTEMTDRMVQEPTKTKPYTS